ncbi:YIP1 family protein [Paenibacillus terrigena]|uniref:YIP1 family protein n=1 Tax=Paenibacillus terrigena TaxID=369333 RepID=UPI0028D07472|nr:YIP1 family protein [Paenibacillus terrigena]
MAIKKVAVWFLVFALLSIGVAVPAFAMPNYSYNYSFWKDPESAPIAELEVKQFYGSDLGIGEFNDPQDVFVDKQNFIYIADTGNNRIVRFDEHGEQVRVFDSFDNGGKQETFNKPYGIHVSDSGDLFVADTQNNRIVRLTQKGTLVSILGPPKSTIIPEDFKYLPLKVAVDKTGRIYVVAQGAYEGIMDLDEQGSFKGYVGTNKVYPNPVDLLWKRLFSTKAQASQMELYLPIEFSNIDLDENGFIYAVNKEFFSEEPIKRINPGGADILRRVGNFKPAGDQHVANFDDSWAFVDVVSEGNGIYSGLDSTHKRIFTYDRDGNLLYQFGGTGKQADEFQKPTAIAMLGDRMLVVDGGINRLILFEPTRYGASIKKAAVAISNGKSEEATEAWKEALKLNGNFEIAYVGMGKAMMKEGNYEQALDYFKEGNNRKFYSQAFKEYRSDYLWNHFGTIMIVLILSIAVVVTGNIIWKKRKQAVHYTEVGIYKAPFHTLLHPFKGFWELKYENKGRMKIALFILLMLFITMILKKKYAGFIVNENYPLAFNSIDELKTIILPFLLFCVANWSLTTLMDGEGKFKEIIMATGYALLPLVIIFLPQILFSNVITSEEKAFYYLLDSIAYLWFLYLLFVGIMTVHQYSAGKTILTLFLTAVAMMVIIFIALLFFNLLSQMYLFIESLYREILVRF